MSTRDERRAEWQAKRAAHEEEQIARALEQLLEFAQTAEQIREAARITRVVANADYDEVSTGELQAMRIANRLADELDRKAAELEA